MSNRQQRKLRKWANKGRREGWLFIGPSQPQTIQWSALADPCNWSGDSETRVWLRSDLHAPPPKIQ